MMAEQGTDLLAWLEWPVGSQGVLAGTRCCLPGHNSTGLIFNFRKSCMGCICVFCFSPPMFSFTLSLKYVF